MIPFSLVAVVNYLLVSTSTTAKVPEINLRALVDSVVDSSMVAEHIPGVAVVVVQNGRIVFSKGYGLANISTGARVDPASTRFRIGSITKAMTSLALLRLIDQGKLHLNDPVAKWLPTLRIKSRYKEPVRVWHLLTHTAGFDQLGDSGRVTFDREKRLGIAKFLDGRLRTVRPPGLASSYDTWGMTLAGLVVEAASGMPYADYMRREIFARAKMDRSDVETPNAFRTELAVGYGFIDGAFVPAQYEYYATTPASSIDATAEDMGRLMIAVLGARSPLLSSAAQKRLGTAQFSSYPGIPSYTYGMYEDSINGQRLIGHGGAMLEYESEMMLIPAIGAGVYVVYNHNGEMGGSRTRLRSMLKRRIMNAWFPAPAIPPRKYVTVDTKRFVGFYATSSYCHTCSEGEGWRFDYNSVRSAEPGVLTINNARWLAVGPLLFVSERNPARKLGFVENNNGEIIYSVDGNDVRERMSELLVDEVFGKQWRTGRIPPLAARMYRVSEDWPRCVKTYAAVATSGPGNGQNWYYMGYCALKAQDFKAAVSASTRAWELGQWPRQTSYQLGAAFANFGNVDKAFEWLEKSAELGYLTRRQMDSDPMLTPLRDDPRFVKLSEKAK